MSLKLIYGRGGSGKTSCIYTEIKEEMTKYPDRDMILLVPDQYTFRAEQKVLKELGQTSVFKVSVMSFSTMIRRILATVGGATHSLISDTGKSMLMTKAMSDVKENLQIFKAVADKPGFIDMAKSLVDEMKRYDMDMEALRKTLAESEDKELIQKFKDILLFYDAFEEEVHKGYVDTMD
ncbi:MAG TPA: hypothetical protein VLM88_00475, partial [Proteiniclasticum sp.]|nr:hypothetical protein [Proteiniclasticum sp.]